jgi:hypothetical protein
LKIIRNIKQRLKKLKILIISRNSKKKPDFNNFNNKKSKFKKGLTNT